MRVLHVIPSVSPRHGGPSFAIASIARACATAGVDVTVATTDDDGGAARLDVPLATAVPRNNATYMFFRRNILPYKVSFGLRRWLLAHSGAFDLVHIHALFSFSSSAAAAAARRCNVPYVVRPLGVLNRWGLENRRAFAKRLSLRLVEVPLLRRSAAIHFTAEAERVEASSIAGVGEVRSAVIPLPVQVPERGDPEVLFQAFPEVRGRQIILFLSRIDRKKGLELLLDAFAEVHRGTGNALLMIAGEGTADYVQELRARSRAAGAQKSIVWAGHLTGDLKAAAFSAAEIFVLASSSENFGIAAAEALGAGVPTILSEEVAVSEHVKTYDAGVVVRRDPRMLAQEMSALLQDRERATRLSANGVRLVQERFSDKAVGEDLRRLYESILARRTN